MDNDVKELIPFMTPDSLRKTLRMLDSFNDTHTKKNCGYEDVDGYEYSGTVENFGSEMLLETRKILMDKPVLENIFTENTFRKYFDIEYSELINTYDQQNMLCAILKKEVLLSNKTYRIQFGNISKIRIPRSESWSDPIVYSDDTYLKTSMPPVMIIKDNDSGDVESYNLKLDTGDNDTTYFFHIGKETEDFIEEINYDTKIMRTVPITNVMNELSFVWICVGKLKLLPPINFHNEYIGWEEDETFDPSEYDNNSFLTIGTNGHDKALIYPWMINNSIPSDDPSHVIIKVYAKEGFLPNADTEYNYTTEIKEIHLLIYDESVDEIATKPEHEMIITYDDTYAKISLNKFSINDGVYKWKFKQANVGDYDYDGTTYNNPYYAYTHLLSFQLNSEDLYNQNNRTQLTAGFIVHFNSEYLHEFEGRCENSVSGIHVDILSDYSENSVPKKNGTIHNLGDFDGLPAYFKYMIDRQFHRSHVELYTIRDRLNKRNQKAMDKQTSAIILDTGLPQTESDALLNELETVISYNYDMMKYETSGDSISSQNFLSEITYIDGNKFGNANIKGQTNYKKFVYHGNNYFSLDAMGFGELEVGRGYLISNDPIVYVNNGDSSNKYNKPPRTIARICDIPTQFENLMHITNTVATFLFDKKYVNHEACFTNDMIESLWNTNSIHVVTKDSDNPHHIDPTIWIFDNDQDLNNVLSVEYLGENYPKYINMNSHIDLNDENTQLEILDMGSGYCVRDTIFIQIGGRTVDGYITNVATETGEVHDIRWTNINDENGYIPISNLEGMLSTFDTVNKTSNGSGLRIKLQISQSTWDLLQQQTQGISDDLISFKRDMYGNIWIWEFDNENNIWIQSVQITGEPHVDNPYDDNNPISWRYRKTSDVMIESWIKGNKFTNISDIDTFLTPSKMKQETVITDITGEDARNIGNYLTSDISSLLSSYNKQDMFYFTEYNSDIDRFILHSYSYGDTGNDLIFPINNLINVTFFHDRTNTLTFIYDDTSEDQIELYVFNPILSVKNIYERKYRDTYVFKDSSDLTFIDVVGLNSEFIDNSGVLTQNVYSYDVNHLLKAKQELYDRLMGYDRIYLVDLIKKDIGNDTYPLRFENTDYAFSKERLVNYYIENTLSNPIYKKDNLSLMRNIGEQVVDLRSTTKPKAIGKQPTGGFINLTSQIHDSKITIEGTGSSNATSEILYIFKMDDNFTGFYDYNIRLRDRSNNDISKNSLVIWDNSIYYFNESSGLWTKIIRKGDK